MSDIRDPAVREPKLAGGLFTGGYWLGLKVCAIHIWVRFVAPLWEEEEAASGAILWSLEETPCGFIVLAFSFLHMKSQSVPGFPFTTRPTASAVSVTSFLASFLASAAERYVHALGFDEKGCLAVVARCACVARKWFLFASLVCLLLL